MSVKLSFTAINAIAALSLWTVLQFLNPPITEAVRPFLQGVVAFYLVVNLVLARALRIKPNDSKGKKVRSVMVASLAKMILTLGFIGVYLVIIGEDPVVFAIAAYLIYAVFSVLLTVSASRSKKAA
jgi:Co/Zn/Cd efflux system component